MARRKKSQQATVSLFPFLSILACVIGTLTLMIAGLAVSQMDTPDLESAERLDKIQRSIDQRQSEMAQLQRQLREAEFTADDTGQQLLAARDEFESLQAKMLQVQEQKDPEPKLLDNAPPPLDTRDLDQRAEQLRKELTERNDEAKKLADEIANRKKPPEETVVLVRPTGSGIGLKPVFVECTKSSIVVHQGTEPTRIRAADIASDAKYGSLVQEVAKPPKDRLVFLIRDDGLGTYNAARKVALGHYAANGKIPVIGHGKLDLSVFQK